MARYIDADRAKRIYVSAFCAEQLDRVPTADVKEVVRGEWKYIDNETVECTNCNMEEFEFCEAYDFCPYCGADMRGKKQ